MKDTIGKPSNKIVLKEFKSFETWFAWFSALLCEEMHVLGGA